MALIMWSDPPKETGMSFVHARDVPDEEADKFIEDLRAKGYVDFWKDWQPLDGKKGRPMNGHNHLRLLSTHSADHMAEDAFTEYLIENPKTTDEQVVWMLMGAALSWGEPITQDRAQELLTHLKLELQQIEVAMESTR